MSYERKLQKGRAQFRQKWHSARTYERLKMMSVDWILKAATL